MLRGTRSFSGAPWVDAPSRFLLQFFVVPLLPRLLTPDIAPSESRLLQVKFRPGETVER